MIDVKTFFKSCLNHGIEFFKTNNNTFASIAMAAAIATISKKYDIPIGYNVQPNHQTSYQNIILIPRNSIEASILSIAKSAKSMSWDTDKVRAAENICQIVNKNGISDETRSFAIAVLSDMAENTSWDTSKRKINKLIMDITKGKC